MRGAIVGALLALAAVPATAGAQIDYFGQNKIQYRDFAWRVLKGPHVDLYYYPEADELAHVALAYAEESVAFLEQKFGHAPPARIPLIIYASHTDFEQTNVLPFVPPEGLLGVTEFLKRRVTLPFTGNYAEFRHTLRHELVHAFQLSILTETYERHPRQSHASLPLWWSEGLAEFWSAGEDGRDEMILRDLTISGRLPSLQELSFIESTVVYPLGGAIHRWLAGRYGEWRIQQMYRDLWKYRSFEDAVLGVYGVTLEQLNNEYLYAFRQHYFPAIAERRPLDITSRQLAELAIKPVAYRLPGDSEPRLLYLSPSTGYMSIYSAPADRPGNRRIEVQGERSAEFESFHSFSSRLDVRNGVAVFTSKYQEHDALFFWDLRTHSVVGRYQFADLVSLLSPAWAPDGRSVIFSALSIGGYSDLYRLWLPDGRLERLTHDRFEDLDPSVSPDGRAIVFASDRTAFGPEGARNLFLMDLATGGVRYLTYGNWQDETPRWASNGRIYFSSDRDTVFDVFSVDTLGNGRRETRTVDGAFDPQFLTATGGLLFSGFSDLTFGIFRTRALDDSVGPSATFSLAADSAPAGWTWPELTDARYGQSTPAPYQQRFSLDFAAGDALVAPGAGAAQGAVFAFSDLLSDHLLYASITSSQGNGTDGFVDSFNGSLFYLNQKRRLNWGAGVFRLHGLFYENDFVTTYEETSYGAFADLRWPFSRFSRVEAEMSVEHSDRFDLVGDNLDDPHRVGWLTSNYVALVHDNALWLATGPIDGDRVNVTLGVTNDLSNGRFDAWSVAGDYRRYLRIGRESAFALRFLGYYADGSRPRQLSIGGTWGLRGYPRIGGVTGTRVFLVNSELRFPIADFVSIGFPFGELRFPGLQGALFGDLGAAGTAFTSHRGVLGSSGLGLRMPLGVLVLRLDLGYRFDLGDVGGYPLTPSDSRRFADFFFGFNY